MYSVLGTYTIKFLKYVNLHNVKYHEGLSLCLSSFILFSSVWAKRAHTALRGESSTRIQGHGVYTILCV